MRGKMRVAGLVLLGCSMSPAFAQKTEPSRKTTATTIVKADSLQDRVAAILAEAPTGTRIGLVVTTEDGREIIAIRPDDRFIPASNTKMFTTAAAYTVLPELTSNVPPRGNAVIAGKGKHPDIMLVGYGDARMSSAPDCTVNCLSTLADAIAKSYKSVGTITGDDTFFADERWSNGMAWNNISGWYGAAISALTLDDNELVLTITPGKVAGEAATVASLPYFTIDNRLQTVASGDTKIEYFRMPNSRDLRLTGTVVAGKEASRLRLGIDDPAHYAAWRLGELLKERKVKVRGTITARHRFADQAPSSFASAPLATLTPGPLSEDVKLTNKVSQNLHTDMLLRRIGAARGEPTVAGGHKAIDAMLASAGVPRTAYDFADGSGMSSYNRVSPRAGIGLLRWVAKQPWGAAWRETLPVGGIDGTLKRRFTGTILEGKVHAKTGTLNQVNALSGYMTTASGKTLIFSSFVNDTPGDKSMTGVIDKALVLIASEN